MTTYRAAYLHSNPQSHGTVLTGPEHATLSDDALLAEARREMEKVGIPDQYDTIDDAMADVAIDDWTESE